MLYLIGKHISDQKLIRIGLNEIYGIGPATAKAICDKFNFNDKVRFKHLNERQKNLLALELASLTLEGQLRKNLRSSVKQLIDLKNYRGVRHKLGLPVRGQRTHSNGKTRKRFFKNKNS